MRWRFSISYLARGEQTSLVSRYFLVAYHLVVLVVSLYPFSGWRFTGEPVLAFLAYPLPFYQTLADNALNVLAYMPIGYAWVMLLRARWYSLALAVVAGAMLSGSIEFAQQFLPSRIASNLDMLTNTAGTFLGGLAAYWMHRAQWVRHWQILRQQWFVAGGLADLGIVLFALWFLTQLDPSVPILGIVVQPAGLPQPFVSPLHDPEIFLRLLEAGGVTLNLVGVSLFGLVLVRPRRHPWATVLGLLLGSLTIKVAAAGLMLKPGEFMAWLNLNVVTGALLGLLILVPLTRLRRNWRALVAALSLAAAQMVAAIWPLTEVLSATLKLFRWNYGHLLHLSGLTQMVSEWWPYAAVCFLLSFAVSEWRRKEVILD
ncbi:VanZ family protein [Parachitinimonas caeni]|uniref:VanZ family protein n=1 Tax=Parachitinimonas caeni TaxID=3031301 RepID=A0ABT7DVL5_9NEIS|nr:VanZ family protein [Parachitinimonas caeni]MDK2124091.1 VanZ family protein [Parachitinimonas caeni]